MGTTCHSKLDGAADGTSCGENKVQFLYVYPFISLGQGVFWYCDETAVHVWFPTETARSSQGFYCCFHHTCFVYSDVLGKMWQHGRHETFITQCCLFHTVTFVDSKKTNKWKNVSQKHPIGFVNMTGQNPMELTVHWIHWKKGQYKQWFKLSWGN